MDRVVEINKDLSINEKDALNRILSRYVIKAEEIEKRRSVYKIYTEKGCYCLKKTKHGDAKSIKGRLLVEYLNKRGFENTPTYYKTYDGEDYVKDKRLYYLMEWIEGEESNLEDIEALKKAVRLLAGFHKAAEGFKPEGMKIMPIKVDWTIDFLKQKEELDCYEEYIWRKSLKTSFDEAYLEVLDRYRRIFDTSIELLEKSNYQSLKESILQRKTVCHNSFYYQNIINKNNEFYLIDLDSTAYDLWVCDLAKFIRRILYKGIYSWDYSIAKVMIDEYEKVNRLSDEEHEILLAFLIFPHKFSKLGRKKYDNKKEWSEAKYLKKLKRIDRNLINQEKFIEQYSKEYIEKSAVD